MDLKKLFHSKKFYIAVLIFVCGLSLNQIVSSLLMTKYGEKGLPVLHDLVLDNIPYLPIMWLYDLFAILGVLAIIGYSRKKGFKYIPYFLVLFGLSQIVRGCFIALTPFGSPNGSEIGLFTGSAFRSGVYPSGHTATVFLTFLLTSGWWKVISFMITLGTILTLLLGRGHYSIDILSGLIFAYAIFMYGEKKLKEKFTI